MRDHASAPRGPQLFDDTGKLRQGVFEPDAWTALEAVVAWLKEIKRARMLPVDLILVLVERGDDALRRAISRAARQVDDVPDIEEQLQGLSSRIDQDRAGTPALHVDGLSLGLTGILEDAAAWAHEAGRDRVREADLVRVVRWRTELQDSASVRWALRQLSIPGTHNFLDVEGSLRSESFSSDVWWALNHAMRLSARGGLPFVGTPHCVAALCQLQSGLLTNSSLVAGVNPTRLQEEVLRLVGSRSPEQSEFPLNRRTLTPRLLKMISKASFRADRDGRRIQESDVLEAFLQDGGSSLELVQALGIEAPLRTRLGEPRVAEFESASATRATQRPAGGRKEEGGHEEPRRRTLDDIGRDLSAEAAAGTLTPVLGREAELQRIINVLLRAEQRNPLLTGEPGVGKTALAVALAQQIHDQRVPKRLRGMRVVEINGAALVGGTSYRGELEARIRNVLKEAEDQVILFIDEAHAVFAPRSGAGQPAEVPNHFKAALASGRIAVIAATTEVEYHRWIEQDPALKRRFERIVIPELGATSTRAILQTLAPTYERLYEVSIHPEALDAAIDLSHRFVPEQSQPDKAKKLLMDAAIAVSSELAITGQPAARSDQTGTPNGRLVTRSDIASQVAMKTGIPLDRIERTSSLAWWAGLGERLQRRVLGQAGATQALGERLLAARLQPREEVLPFGLFALVGPPDVGQFELAKALAQELFGSERALLRIDMGDYQEAHSLSRLTGAAPGYVGYQEEDALVAPLRRRPAQVVYLPGFDLAHPRIQERLLRMLREGEVTDTRGLRADLRHALFLLSFERDTPTRSAIGFQNESDPDEKLLEPEVLDRLRQVHCELIALEGVGQRGSQLTEALVTDRLQRFRTMLREEYGHELDLEPAVLESFLKEARNLKDSSGLEPLFRRRVVEPVLSRLLKGTADAAPDEANARPQRVIK